MRSLSPSSFLAIAALGAATAGLFTPVPALSENAAKPASAPAAPGKPAPAPKPPSLIKKPEVSDYDLKPRQLERLQKFLPKAFSKLSHRDPFHIVAVGDEMTGMPGHGEENGDLLKAWPVRFADELASQFLYTGGVRVIHPNPGKLSKANVQQGQEITVRCLPQAGALMSQAIQELSTRGFESPPDLVIVSCGVYDARSPEDLGIFAKALHHVVETVREKGCELLLVGPTINITEPAATSLGAASAFAGMMSDEADNTGVIFADAGDLSRLVKLDAATQEPATLVENTLKQCRRFFAWRGATDTIHPVPELYRLVGRQVFDVLVDGPAPSPWKLNGATATFDKADHFILSGEIENTGKTPLKLCAAALETPSWKTATVLPKLEIQPGAKQPFKLGYVRNVSDTPANAEPPPFPSHEAFLRLPLLLSGGGMTRIEDMHADIKPLAMIWKMDTLYNQSGTFMLDNAVANKSGKALKGITWTAACQGQKLDGRLDLAPNATSVLPLKFNLPKGSARQAMPVMLDITADGVTLHWQRFVECQPNLGLKGDTDLVPLGSGKAKVSLQANADKSWLTLMLDFKDVALKASPQGTAALLQLSLDARSYGKRQIFGSVDAVTIHLGTTDGPGHTDAIAPWAFGTGYGMMFDPHYVRGQLTSSPGGGHRITVTLPRSYLYLHEWALGNGNSELGINARLAFWQDDGFSADSTYSLTNNLKSATDAQGLAVLELTDRPTSRWSVIIW